MLSPETLKSRDFIKSQERLRCGGPNATKDPIILKGPNMIRSADFKEFLQVNENKKSLAKMMLQVWSSDQAADHLKNKEIILIVFLIDTGILFWMTSTS